MVRNKIDIDFIFEQDTYSNSDVKRYYKKTKYLLYRLISKEGYMHIGLSDDGRCLKMEGISNVSIR